MTPPPAQFQGVVLVVVVALLVLVRCHVSRQMVALSERLVAHRTPQLVLLPPPPSGVHGHVLPLVVRPHVIHEVGRHPERDLALGADVLGGEGKRDEGRWKQGCCDAGGGCQEGVGRDRWARRREVGREGVGGNRDASVRDVVVLVQHGAKLLHRIRLALVHKVT